MHKGHLRLRLSFTGVPAHSGLPHLGVNAVEAPAGRSSPSPTSVRHSSGSGPRTRNTSPRSPMSPSTSPELPAAGRST
jgi:acetylornithine deacetylase/succinyl-diaminopimelate desuccinylase-like protein